MVQVGWLEGKRKILGVWEVEPEMKVANVVFREVYKAGRVVLGLVSRTKA